MSNDLPPIFPGTRNVPGDVIALGVPHDAISYPQTGTYPMGVAFLSRRMRWVFIGPTPNLTDYASLEMLILAFNSDVFDGFILTAYNGAMQGEKGHKIFRSILERVAGYIEIRKLNPAKGIELSFRISGHKLPGEEVWSSFASIALDSLSDQEEVAAILARQATDSDAIHILPPRNNVASPPPNFAACISGLRHILHHSPKISDCTLPLDLFDSLEDPFHMLNQRPSFEALELTAPVTTALLHLTTLEDLQWFTTSLPRHLSVLTAVRELTLPISFAVPAILSSIASLPSLMRLRLRPDRMINSVHILLEALSKAALTYKGPGCFASLQFLDLGSWDSDLQQRMEVDVVQLYRERRELFKIFQNTRFEGDWLTAL